MKKYRVIISIEISTANSEVNIKNAITKGIYRGLDSNPEYIAQPKDVLINDIRITDATDLIQINHSGDGIAFDNSNTPKAI